MTISSLTLTILKRRVAERRAPEFIIGGADDPYLRRWWVIPRNRWFNIYLHHFLHSDDDRALHDHPWWNASWLLDGIYLEHTSGRQMPRARYAGSVYFRAAKTAHRVELIGGEPVWTLFFTGPIIREWGFLCPQGWRHWREFTSARDKGSVGRGCS